MNCIARKNLFFIFHIFKYIFILFLWKIYLKLNFKINIFHLFDYLFILYIILFIYYIENKARKELKSLHYYECSR